MAKKDNSKKAKKAKPETVPQSVDLNVGGDMKESVAIVGNHNVVNYYAAVYANTKQNEPDYWNLKHPYPMPPNFTGRIAERALLTQWLDGDTENRLFILRALGGFGKSALTWHWLTHDVNTEIWKKVVFWSFYEGDASFENFTRNTLEYLGVEVPQGGRPQVDELLKAMQRDNILLIMDGFERVLRLYASMNAAYQGDEEKNLEEHQLDCKDINAEWFLKGICSNPKIKSKVLMATRLTPRAVKSRGEFLLGCRQVELTAMQKEDVVEFFHKQGIQGHRVEIETACEPYGYHPLSLRLLAGRILKDFENPADIVVAQRLKIDGDIVQQRHHVLEVSYISLSSNEQELLGMISCFRSHVELKTLETIAKNKTSLKSGLSDLMERGLISFDRKNKKFDLHPIVRRYVYESFSSKEKTHKKLANYFQKQIDSQAPEQYHNFPKSLRKLLIARIQKPPQKLDDLASSIELFYHTTQAGMIEDAVFIYHQLLMMPLFFQFAAYQLEVELVSVLLKKSSKIKSATNKAWASSELASAYSMIGQSLSAIPLLKDTIRLHTKLRKDKGFLITDYENLAAQYLSTGSLLEAERALLKAHNICVELELIHDAFAVKHNMARVLSYCGVIDGAKKMLDQS